MSLNRYLKLQQDQLQALGREQQVQQQRRQLEQTRFDQLQQFHAAVCAYRSTDAVSLRNRVAMCQQVELYLGAQEQELMLSELELKAKQQQLLAQFGKVKGLQQIQKKHAGIQAKREQRGEQHRLDDWLSGARRTD